MYKRKLILFILCAVPSYLTARIYPEGQEPVQEEVKQAINMPLEYAYVYIQPDRAVRLMAEDINEKGEGNIPFDGNGSMTSGITHVLGSSEIVLAKAGVYQVNFMGTATLNKPDNVSFSGTEPTIALFLNDQRIEGTGSLIPHKQIKRGQGPSILIGGKFGRMGEGQPFNIILNDKRFISMQAIITVNAGDILTVKWHGRRLVAGEFLDIWSNTSIVIKQLASQ